MHKYVTLLRVDSVVDIPTVEGYSMLWKVIDICDDDSDIYTFRRSLRNVMKLERATVLKMLDDMEMLLIVY